MGTQPSAPTTTTTTTAPNAPTPSLLPAASTPDPSPPPPVDAAAPTAIRSTENTTGGGETSGGGPPGGEGDEEEDDGVTVFATVRSEGELEVARSAVLVSLPALLQTPAVAEPPSVPIGGASAPPGTEREPASAGGHWRGAPPTVSPSMPPSAPPSPLSVPPSPGSPPAPLWPEAALAAAIATETARVLAARTGDRANASDGAPCGRECDSRARGRECGSYAAGVADGARAVTDALLNNGLVEVLRLRSPSLRTNPQLASSPPSYDPCSRSLPPVYSPAFSPRRAGHLASPAAAPAHTPSTPPVSYACSQETKSGEPPCAAAPSAQPVPATPSVKPVPAVPSANPVPAAPSVKPVPAPSAKPVPAVPSAKPVPVRAAPATVKSIPPPPTGPVSAALPSPAGLVPAAAPLAPPARARPARVANSVLPLKSPATIAAAAKAQTPAPSASKPLPANPTAIVTAATAVAGTSVAAAAAPAAAPAVAAALALDASWPDCGDISHVPSARNRMDTLKYCPAGMRHVILHRLRVVDLTAKPLATVALAPAGSWRWLSACFKVHADTAAVKLHELVEKRLELGDMKGKRLVVASTPHVTPGASPAKPETTIGPANAAVGPATSGGALDGVAGFPLQTDGYVHLWSVLVILPHGE